VTRSEAIRGERQGICVQSRNSSPPISFGGPVRVGLKTETTDRGDAANDRSNAFNVRYRTYLICINVFGLSRPQIYFSPGIQAIMPRYGKGLRHDRGIFTAWREVAADRVI
jgi:hypothetical protein